LIASSPPEWEGIGKLIEARFFQEASIQRFLEAHDLHFQEVFHIWVLIRLMRKFPERISWKKGADENVKTIFSEICEMPMDIFVVIESLAWTRE
jgi:hypothetical protein